MLGVSLMGEGESTAPSAGGGGGAFVGGGLPRLETQQQELGVIPGALEHPWAGVGVAHQPGSGLSTQVVVGSEGGLCTVVVLLVFVSLVGLLIPLYILWVWQVSDFRAFLAAGERAGGREGGAGSSSSSTHTQAAHTQAAQATACQVLWQEAAAAAAAA